MDDILLLIGHSLSIPFGKFTNRATLVHDGTMQTIDETRRVRLEMLIQRYGGKIANLNEALGYERTNAQLARIRNKNKRTDRPGKEFVMGDAQAREIEQKLSLDHGWMDTPPSPIELYGEHDPRTKMQQLMDGMSQEQLNMAVRLLGAIAQPVKANGTDGKQ